jgi:predicted nucleic acid-binding protein
MILVDTSIWIEHFRIGVAGLYKVLEHADVCLHPFVLGELACGHLKNRNQILRLLPSSPLCRSFQMPR